MSDRYDQTASYPGKNCHTLQVALVTVCQHRSLYTWKEYHEAIRLGRYFPQFGRSSCGSKSLGTWEIFKIIIWSVACLTQERTCFHLWDYKGTGTWPGHKRVYISMTLQWQWSRHSWLCYNMHHLTSFEMYIEVLQCIACIELQNLQREIWQIMTALLVSLLHSNKHNLWTHGVLFEDEHATRLLAEEGKRQY